MRLLKKKKKKKTNLVGIDQSLLMKIGEDEMIPMSVSKLMLMKKMKAITWTILLSLMMIVEVEEMIMSIDLLPTMLRSTAVVI